MAAKKAAKKPVKTRIRVGDLVQVISGRGAAGRKRRVKDGEDTADRQQRGKVLSIDRVKGTAIVEGVKKVFKHQRPSQDPNAPRVGRIEKEAPIALSNLMLVDPASGEPTRVGIKIEMKERENGRPKARRVRVARKSGNQLPEK